MIGIKLDRTQAQILYFSTQKADPAEWQRVKEKAQEILTFIKANKFILDAMNKSGTSSEQIEEFLKPEMLRMGFTTDTEQEYDGLKLDPDFINREWKVLVEVERGKTI